MYRDRWIECTASGIRVRGYYFPWGTKRIRYSTIRSVRRVQLSVFRGRARVWGTANPRYWASLDPARPRKHVGFVVDTGRFVRPVLTPEDPDTFEAELRAHVTGEPGSVAGPVV